MSDSYFCMIQSQHGDRIVYEIEKSFTTAKEAAEFFVSLRIRQEIRIDFEKAFFNQSKEHNEQQNQSL